ncbi:MAG: hypothetical protein RL407_1664 [Bacteroidota bacterium]|jgi:UDP-glucuronate decarboxylase
MKRVLVSGGAGFLGSHLCDRLLQEGSYVLCLDNFFSGNKQNIEKQLENRNFELIQEDVRKPLSIQVDEIYNLACPASPQLYQKYPIETFTTSILGAMNLLELAKANRSKILQASTSEVYGNPEIHPQPESYFGNVNPIGPRACYDEGKRGAETLFFDYFRMHELPIKVMRIFNTYGPRMSAKDGRVVSSFILQALKGEDLSIQGDGSQTRSFCFVEDTIEAMIRLMKTPKNITGPINIGNSNECSILELAHLILELTQSKSKLVFLPSSPDDPKQRKPQLFRAMEVLDWAPRISLKEGLQKTIAYFEATLNTSETL